MVKLKLVEDTEQRLVFRLGMLAMLMHMSLCTIIVAVVAVSLTMLLQHYIGVFAFVVIALPGIVFVICGIFGCANARDFTFAFDRTAGEFSARAGGVRIARPLREIVLVHIERECGSGGFFGGDAPAFAVCVLFTDRRRCRLEGGVTTTGTGRGPGHFHEAAEKIRAFLDLPQTNVPILNVARPSKDRRSSDEHGEGGESVLARWLACRGIAPRFEEPLLQYDWAESPEGAVRLVTGRGLLGLAEVGASASGLGGRWARPPGRGRGGTASFDPALGPVVIGVPQSTVRSIQAVVPEGMPGRSMTVIAPDGSQVIVDVPATMRPGETLTIQY